jgi:hypothetical protein
MNLSRTTLRGLVAAGCAVLALCLPQRLQAQAQATTGVIRGVVTDSANAPVAGALVTMRNLETNISRAVRTARDLRRTASATRSV